MMRGRFEDQGKLFSYVSPEARVPADHPLRAMREIVRSVLRELHGDFAKLYSDEGRPSIPPEHDARRKCEAWRRDYNEERPHSAIGANPPIEFINRSAPHGPL